MKKGILSLLIICLIIPFIITVISNSASQDVIFTVGSMNAAPGDQITITVNMNCTNSFSAGNFILRYDSSVLTYSPYTDDSENYGETISGRGHIEINSNQAGTIKIGYISNNDKVNLSNANGTFLKFRFNVKSNATTGNSQVSIETTTLKNANGEDKVATTNNGYVSVLSAITMNKQNLEILKDNQDQLTISALPTGAKIYNEITWSSSDPTKVSVERNSSDTTKATIRAIAKGTARITATVNGVTGRTAICDVTVTEPEQPYSITINSSGWSILPRTQKRNLNAVFNPTNAGNGKQVTWSSEDTSIATVAQSSTNPLTAEVTAKNDGRTNIVVTDGKETAKYPVEVKGMLGSYNGTSTISAYDAYRALILSTSNDPDQNEVAALDVNRDKVITSNDAYLILKRSVGLITDF